MYLIMKRSLGASKRWYIHDMLSGVHLEIVRTYMANSAYQVIAWGP
jgi:hypothetical protein